MRGTKVCLFPKSQDYSGKWSVSDASNNEESPYYLQKFDKAKISQIFMPTSNMFYGPFHYYLIGRYRMLACLPLHPAFVVLIPNFHLLS